MWTAKRLAEFIDGALMTEEVAKSVGDPKDDVGKGTTIDETKSEALMVELHDGGLFLVQVTPARRK